MKAYGLPRDQNCEFPDVADCAEFALPGCVGNVMGKSGDYRSHFKSATAKRARRRSYKRRARRVGKLACAEVSS